MRLGFGLGIRVGVSVLLELGLGCLLEEGVAVAAHEEGRLELLLPLHEPDARAQLRRLWRYRGDVSEI